MKVLFSFFAIITISFESIFAQEVLLKHTNGPMGGIVGDIAINSKGDIYAGVYSAFIEYAGLYKSTDNGDSWSKIKTQFDDFEVYAIYITEEDHIWVGTNFQGRVYLSTDNGLSWQNKRKGYNTGECWAFGESKDGVLFAGDGQYFQLYRSTDYGENWELSANLRPFVFATDSNNTVYAGTHDGLFATKDNGLIWAQNNFFAGVPVSSILIDSSDNIYCGTGYYDNGNGVFFSSDGGVNWTQIGLAGKIVLSLGFDSQGNLYAGTKHDGLYKTTDMGQTWIHYDKGLYKKQLFRLKLNKQDDIFIGSEYEGVFRSTNSGEEFEQVGLPTSNLKNICFWGDSLIFASTPSGVQSMNVHTKKWTNLGLHDVFGIAISPGGILYAATFADGLFKSFDFGKNWLLTNLNKDSIMSTYNVLALNDDTVFVATEFNLRKTTDGGESWLVLPVKTNFFSRGMYLNNSDLWVTGFGKSTYNLYKSEDGIQFDSTFSGFDWSENNCISGLKNGIIFITDRSLGTFRTTNNGGSWQKILPGKQSIWTVYSGEGGLILGGARDSLWISSNYGDNWYGIPLPLKRNSNITEIKKGNDSQLYIGTYAEGLFEADIITGLEEGISMASSYFLSQNYPNPFNPSTYIKFKIANTEFVSLKIYDVLGKEIAVLINEEKEPGEYEINFNAAGLTSGVYFYKLSATPVGGQPGSFTETKKMILLR